MLNDITGECAHTLILVVLCISFSLQCFDTVRWATGTASGL